MASVEQGPVSNRLVERVKNILFTPNTEWDVIEAEPATIQGLYKGYICVLAAIGPIAQFIGSQMFGYHALWITYRPSFVSSLIQAVVSYFLSLAGVYVLALIIDGLAPGFGAQKNQIQAFKVAAYSMTAFWVFAVFSLVPMVSALGVLGLYSLYLFYLGLPKLMKAPGDKALVYSVVTIVAAVVVLAVINGVSYSIVGSGGMPVASGGSLSVN